LIVLNRERVAEQRATHTRLARHHPRSAGILPAAAILAAATLATPAAGADPYGFPDLSRFTAVAPDSPVYVTNRGGGRNAVFATPDGLACNAGPDLQSCRSSAVGGMPGFPSTARHQELSACGPVAEQVSSSKDSGEFIYTRNCEGDSDVTTGLPVLHPGQKVTVINTVTCKTVGDIQIPNCTPGVHGQVTCAVGDDRLTACTNGIHGFVLKPTGSWSF
jgi:hypothetical protein